jgi:hypothetical protein
LITLQTSSVTSPAEISREAEDKRRDLRRLVVLELVQTTLGVGALLGVLLRGVVLGDDRRAALTMVVLGLFAVALLVLAFRVRMGAELLRRDLRSLEGRSRATGRVIRVHPYRWSNRRDPMRSAEEGTEWIERSGTSGGRRSSRSSC